MKISTSTSLKTAAIFGLVSALFLLPTAVFANITITKVMYDPEGSDQGREWIELTNTGSGAVSLFNYRLYEGGTNHKLAVTSGTSTIEAGTKAIITTDPAQYAADHPSFVGAIFKSSFSLSNSGETIELRDAKLALVDSYSYIAPPVVKKPAAAKVAKTSKSKSSASNYVYTGSDQAAALPLAVSDLPSVPLPEGPWVYGLGLVAVLVLGVGAAFYLRPSNNFATSGASEEFNIE